ncbi:MAG: protein kinase, partial [Deltaproteobacteria bacterium]|nr:protein kinase [Deltaproteobacteria bacterium]
ARAAAAARPAGRGTSRYRGTEEEAPAAGLGGAHTALSVAAMDDVPLPDVEGPPDALAPELELTPEQISAIAKQVAVAAAAQARRGLVMTASLGDRGAARPAREHPGRPAYIVAGLEAAAVPLEGLNDSAAMAARGGPSIETLEGFISGHGCDLGTIEVYYRLGMAFLAEGKWAAALQAFDQVEEASPGYRDAERRAANLRQWQDAVGPRMTLAAQGGVARTPDAARYRIQGELGRGGMAVVYRAHDEVLGRDVALKFLSDELLANKDARELFQREARSVAALNHPNIITVFDFGVLEGKTFICMEYVDGVSVQQLLEERGKLTVVEALRIARQVLDGLEYAHDKSIIHRDIKPSNMMQTKTGLVKLMDFGLAKSVAKGAKASMVAGTPPYMPAEQIAGGDVDHRADIFAVGCSLYEMLTGRLPFEGFDRAKAPSSVQTFDPSLPPVLDNILNRALASQPDQRYETASAFNAPIRRILDVLDSYAAGGSAPPPPSPLGTARTQFAGPTTAT